MAERRITNGSSQAIEHTVNLLGGAVDSLPDKIKRSSDHLTPDKASKIRYYLASKFESAMAQIDLIAQSSAPTKDGSFSFDIDIPENAGQPVDPITLTPAPARFTPAPRPPERHDGAIDPTIGRPIRVAGVKRRKQVEDDGIDFLGDDE